MVVYADDLQPGQQFQLGSHTVTEQEIIEFGRLWDPLVMHTDPVAAADMPVGGVIASGLHTFAVYQRLAVASFWHEFANGLGRGFEIEFRRPARPGTRLTGRVTVQSVTPRPGRGDAELTMAAELTDDRGTAVLTLRSHTVVPMRSAPGDGSPR